MKELIDRAKVLKYLTPRIKTETPYGEGYNKALEDSAALVTLMPTIEAEPVRHGRWVFQKGDNKETVDGWICTNCKSGFHTKVPYFEAFKYCPMCGARMDATDTNVGGKGGTNNG